MMAENEGVVDENSVLSPGSANCTVANAREQLQQQQQPGESEHGSNSRSDNVDVVTTTVATVVGVNTEADDKSSNNAGNEVDCDNNVDDVDEDDDGDDGFSSDGIPAPYMYTYRFDPHVTWTVPKHLQKHNFVRFATEFRSKLEGMPSDVIQRTLPGMYRGYRRYSDKRDWYPWSTSFCHGFTECFRYASKPGHAEKCPPWQIDWVNETIAFQGDHHEKLHLCLDNKAARLVHYMAVEDIKKFARICWRCPRLTSIVIMYEVKFDRKLNYFFLEAGASSAHNRLEQLQLMLCGCRLPTSLGSMIMLVQPSTTLTTIELIMHDVKFFSSRTCCRHKVASKPPSCVNSNRILLEGVLECKSLRELILFPPAHGDDPAFMPMVEAALIRRRVMQGQGLFMLQYKGPRGYDDHAPLGPATAFFLMRGALSGSVERLDLSKFTVKGSTIAQLAEAARVTPLESKLALKHLQMMDFRSDWEIHGAKASESMSCLLAHLPCLEYVGIGHRYLIPQSVPQAPAPIVCFFMDSHEFRDESLDHFFELLPSSMIRALHVKVDSTITDVLLRHKSSFRGLQELHIDERFYNTDHYGNYILTSRLLDILIHNTNLLKCSCSTYGSVRLDNKLDQLCHRNCCIRMLKSFRGESTDCLVPAALAYLGRMSTNLQSASSSMSSSVAVTSTTANVSVSAVFTFLQKQQLEIRAITNFE